MASTRAPLARFVTASGARVYRMPVETFPNHINNVYLILDGPHSTLVDVGSGFDQSVADLRSGFEEVDLYREFNPEGTRGFPHTPARARARAVRPPGRCNHLRLLS